MTPKITAKIENIQQKLDRLKGNKLRYEQLEEKLKALVASPQISTTDSDGRQSLISGQVVEISQLKRSRCTHSSGSHAHHQQE
jgi:flagellar biosynthesis chaperone FliJ